MPILELQTLYFEDIEVNVEVIELIETGRRGRLKCECLVDGKVVLDGEGVLSVPRAQAPAS